MKKNNITQTIQCIFLIALLLSGVLSSTAEALSGYRFLHDNNILFYNPSASTACRAGSSSSGLNLPTLVGNNNAEKIWRVLVDKGLSAEQAAGIMGNIQQESNFEPGAKEAIPSWAGEGYGIIQWTAERRTTLESKAKEQGVDASDLSFQLAYLFQEIQGEQVGTFGTSRGRHKPQFGSPTDDLLETIKKQTTVLDATILFHDGFLRSNDSTADIEGRRADYAENAYKSFKNLATAVAVPEAGSGGLRRDGCDSNFAGGDLIQTLLAYAWPTYTDASYPLNPQPKPAYLEAATKADSEGKWVGGGKSEIGIPGIDCGGFVSLLLVNSGFEPNYNYGLGAGSGNQNNQQAWAEEHWTYLGSSDTINASDLQPGDVAYTNGHTFVYIGDVDGFGSKYASASYSYSGRNTGTYSESIKRGDENIISWRAPMAGYESAALPGYVWYGKRSSDSSTQSKPTVKSQGDS